MVKSQPGPAARWFLDVGGVSVDIDERIASGNNATHTTGMTDYTTITNGNELVDAGVIPKSSSELMALITHERLKALQERASKAIDPASIQTVRCCNRMVSSVLSSPNESCTKSWMALSIPETISGSCATTVLIATF